MDIIIKSQLNEFISEFGYEGIKIDVAFEKFCNYSIISKEYMNEALEAYQIEQTSIGGGNDNGIDGIAIIVNDILIYNEQEIIEIANKSKSIDVHFCFIQSKSSNSFIAEEIATFLFGVKDIFSNLNNPSTRTNWGQKIQHHYELISKIYSYSSKMNKGLPKLKLFYATTGVWNSENHHSLVRINADKTELNGYGLFANIDICLLGSKEIQSLYTHTKNKVSADIRILNKMTLPDINGIGESYYGLIPFEEYKKVIIDDNDNLKNVFYDNVRAFQGLNPVNKSIDKTIKDKKIDIFPLLNNGVTIIAKEVNPVGNMFTINDYQIVNGCQTSHVLYQNRNDNEISKMLIPIRVIESSDESVKSQIIIATNSQTEVKREQLIALSEFQKDLEKYFSSINGKGKLYYERQSKQYSGDTSVPKNRVISIPIQIISFTSMFLDEPHNVRGYYSKILENVERVGKYIFSQEHKYSSYYTSALAYNRLEELFKKELLDHSFRKAKHHLLLTFRLLAEERNKPKLNNSQMDRYCETINEKLLDDDKCLSIYRVACKTILDTLPNKILLDRNINHLLTKDIAQRLGKYVQVGRVQSN